MKLVQVLLSRRIGGAETLASGLAAAWSESGVDESTVYLDDESSSSGRLSRIWRLRRELARQAPDFVIAHSYLPGLYTRVVWGRKAPVHVVLHSASDDHASRLAQLVERLLLTRTASVIAVSEQQYTTYLSHFVRSPRTTVIPNGVVPAITAKVRQSSAPSKVVTISRVARQKRPDFWRKVTELAAHEAPTLSFEWWGPQSGEPELDGVMVGLDEPRVRYMGPTDDVAAVLDRADIVFHSADREAASILLLEAAVSGTPIVFAKSVEAPESHEYWTDQYDTEDVTDAVSVLADVTRDWHSRSHTAANYAVTAREKWGMQGVANDYLAWIFPR